MYRNFTGNHNSFLGRGAGFSDISGSNNTFVGSGAGANFSIGSNNTFLGRDADSSTSNLTNATAIGSLASVSQSNSLILGSINGTNGATADTNVGIGTSSPAHRLHVVGTSLFTGFVRAPGGVFIANPNTLFIHHPVALAGALLSTTPEP